MANRIEKHFGEITVVQLNDGKWGIVNSENNEIVPFGKYDWIDSFDQGLARVKVGNQSNAIDNNGNKWGIINEAGEEVLPVEYDNIWNFCGKGRYSTKVVQGGNEFEVYFHDLNPDLPVRGIQQFEENSDEEDSYGSHFGEYAGSYAQDVAGYSDDVINDAFEGDSDAYWNID